MKNQATHTPTPWAVEPRQWDQGASLAIVAPENGYIVAIIPFDEDIQEVDEPDGDTVIRHPDEEPNAAHIVRCVNSHEALLKALNDIDLRVTQATIASGIVKQKDRTEFLLSELARIKAVAFSAIAQAEAP